MGPAAILKPLVICMVETVTEIQTVLVIWSVAWTIVENFTQLQGLYRKFFLFIILDKFILLTICSLLFICCNIQIINTIHLVNQINCLFIFSDCCILPSQFEVSLHYGQVPWMDFCSTFRMLLFKSFNLKAWTLAQMTKICHMFETKYNKLVAKFCTILCQVLVCSSFRG